MKYNHKAEKTSDAIGCSTKKLKIIKLLVAEFITERAELEYVSERIELLEEKMKDLSYDDKILFTYFLYDYGETAVKYERKMAQQVIGELILDRFESREDEDEE